MLFQIIMSAILGAITAAILSTVQLGHMDGLSIFFGYQLGAILPVLSNLFPFLPLKNAQ